MLCYNHPEKSAVGICKSCGKGLCKECLTEMKNGIACKKSCEERVTLINDMLERDEISMKVGNTNIKYHGYFSIAGGTIFFVLGLFFFLRNFLLGAVFTMFGLAMIISGALKFKKESLFPERKKDTEN